MLAFAARSSISRWVGGESVNTAAIPYNRAVSRCVRSSRAWRERSRVTLYSATERLLVSSSHGRLALSSVVAPRERLDERCTPRPSGFRAFLAQPSGVIVSRGRCASGSANAVFLVRAAPVPGVLVSRGRRAGGSTNAVFRLRAASTRVASDARAVRRTLYSSSERFPPPSSAVPAGATFLNTPVDRPHTLDTIRLHGGRSCARNPRELRVRSGAPSGRRCELRLLSERWRAARRWSRSRSPRSR